MILRLIFIIVGVAVITLFQILLVGLDLVLIYTGVKIFKSGEQESNPADTRAMKIFNWANELYN